MYIHLCTSVWNVYVLVCIVRSHPPFLQRTRHLRQFFWVLLKHKEMSYKCNVPGKVVYIPRNILHTHEELNIPRIHQLQEERNV